MAFLWYWESWAGWDGGFGFGVFGGGICFGGHLLFFLSVSVLCAHKGIIKKETKSS
jgi:hypothetical protein